MLYITGDIHGETLKTRDRYHLVKSEKHVDYKNIKSEDRLLICGDFGLPFLHLDVTRYEAGYTHTPYSKAIKFYKDLGCEVLWVDGNHENFNFWRRIPVEDWNGGKVQRHPHADNILHLMRGEIYNIDGKSFLTIGGAVSIDKSRRIEGYSWWSQEEISDEEIARTFENLERVNWEVDYIVTHTIPDRFILGLDNIKSKVSDKTAQFLDSLYEKVKFKHWYAGHFHLNQDIEDTSITVLYEDIRELDDSITKED